MAVQKEAQAAVSVSCVPILYWTMGLLVLGPFCELKTSNQCRRLSVGKGYITVLFRGKYMALLHQGVFLMALGNAAIQMIVFR